MRLIARFLLFWISQLSLADSYYNAETCGRPHRERRSADDEWGRVKSEMKVMGGVDAWPGELPWSVYFDVPYVINNNPSKTPWALCGGIMISSRHLLTAAHCFKLGYEKKGCDVVDMMSIEEIAREIVFVVGATCRANERGRCPKKDEGVERQATRVAFNKQFFEDNCTKSYYDVALIELSEDVDTPHVCLPHLHEMDQFDPKVDDLFSFGFGMDPTNKLATTLKLQFIDLGPVHPPEKCMQVYDLPYDGIVCTQETTVKNVCKGDSGGGILTMQEKRYYLQGIISYGSPCEKPKNRALVEANAQVNIDVNLFTATIDKYIRPQTPDYRDQWRDVL